MRFAILLVCFILIFSLSCYAAEIGNASWVTRGYVYVNIINNPPEIREMVFSPETAYKDSTLACIPTALDEVPDEVVFEYKWYRDGNLVEDKGSEISEFSEGETVSCEAIPIDVAGQRGVAYSKAITITETPLSTKIELAVLNVVGAGANTEKLIALEKQGLGAITGFAVEEMGSSRTDFSYLGVLVALVLLFILVDTNLLIRHIIRRKHIQKQN